MREVPAKLFGFMREMSRGAGADVEAAQRGLALRNVDVDAPGGRVDWDEVATFLERAHGHLAPDRIEALGESYVETHVWQQLIARLLGTPRLMYEVCSGALTRASFPHLYVDVESHAGGVRIEWQLPERYAPCEVMFRSGVGQLRRMPTLLGLAPAPVRADVGPRHGIYDIALDEPVALDRAVGAARRVTDRVVVEAIGLMRFAVTADRHEDASSSASVLDLQRGLGLSHAEARVASRLASGLGVKEIASALGIRVSTVRSHLQSIYGKTGARSQAELVRLVLTRARRQG